ncbi:hypothetical protein RJ641_021623, partial [Dillenia turbinata]
MGRIKDWKASLTCFRFFLKSATIATTLFRLSAVGALLEKDKHRVINTFLTNIKRLFGGQVSIEHDCLKTILEGCNELVLLDVRDCIASAFMSFIVKRSCKSATTLRLPQNCTEDDLEFFQMSKLSISSEQEQESPERSAEDIERLRGPCILDATDCLGFVKDNEILKLAEHIHCSKCE